MADGVLDLGALAFATLNFVAVFCAGVAALPPARDTPVFLGALTMGLTWVVATWSITQSGSWFVTSTMVGLDIVYALIFLKLASPRKGDTPHAVYERNWASHVVAVFAVIIVLELCNVLYRFEGPHQAPIGVGFLALAAIIAFGFGRGFGMRSAAIFVFGATLIGTAAVISYVRTVNFLTLMIIVIIIHGALRGAGKNLRAWLKLTPPPAGRSSHDEDPPRDPAVARSVSAPALPRRQ